MYNFTAAIVKALEPPKASEGKCASGQEASENADVKEMCIAFSQAVTVCRKLLEAHTLSYIKKAIEIIKGHTFAKKPGRAYARKVKPQSYRPFGYKTSETIGIYYTPFFRHCKMPFLSCPKHSAEQITLEAVKPVVWSRMSRPINFLRSLI